MPWIALVPDISGVCSVFGTFEMTSKPTNAASTRIVISVSRLIGAPLGGRARRRLPWRPRATISPSRVMQAPAIISSSKSSFRAPSSSTIRLEQRLDVARVELGSVVGHRRRQVQRADDLDAVRDDGLAGLGQLAVAAGLGGEVDDHRARGASARPRRSITSSGARRPGISGGRDHDVASARSRRRAPRAGAAAPRRSARARSRRRPRRPRGRCRARRSGRRATRSAP